MNKLIVHPSSPDEYTDLASVLWYFEHTMACFGLNLWEFAAYQNVQKHCKKHSITLNPIHPPDIRHIQYLDVMSAFAPKGALVKITLPTNVHTCASFLDKLISMFSSKRLIELQKYEIEGVCIELEYDIYAEMAHDAYIQNCMQVAFYRHDEYAFIVVKYLMYIQQYLAQTIQKIPTTHTKHTVAHKISNQDQYFVQNPLGFILQNEPIQPHNIRPTQPFFVQDVVEDYFVDAPFWLPDVVQLAQDKNVTNKKSVVVRKICGAPTIYQMRTHALTALQKNKTLAVNSLTSTKKTMQAQTDTAKNTTSKSEEAFIHCYYSKIFNYCAKIHYQHQHEHEI